MTTHLLSPRLRQPDHRLISVVAIALSVGLLSGCALFEGPAPDAPTRPTPVVPDAPVELAPDGSAEASMPSFIQTLTDFAATEAPIEGRPVVDALVAAGFDRAAMQVTKDRTLTNLVADNIFVSVLMGSDCLIGQIVTGDRSLVTEVAPALGPDTNICLIGNTRVIDW